MFWIEFQSLGIGKGLAAHYLAEPNTTVIGTVRDFSSEKAQDLTSLPKGHASGLIVVPFNADRQPIKRC